MDNEYVIDYPRKSLTVHQRALDFLLVGHDEGTVLEYSLVEGLPSDLLPGVTQEKSAMKMGCLPIQIEYHPFQMLVSRQSHRPRWRERVC